MTMTMTITITITITIAIAITIAITIAVAIAIANDIYSTAIAYRHFALLDFFYLLIIRIASNRPLILGDLEECFVN